MTIGLLFSIIFCDTSVLAQPIRWNIDDGGNGHYYEHVAIGTNWSCAKQLAEQHVFDGSPGHLATITSQDELDFFRENFLIGRSIWLGGFQDTNAEDYFEPDGGWRWVTGEPWDFTAWSTTDVGGNDDEPNNAGDEGFLSSEESITSDGDRYFGWNDSPDIRLRAYFVEYENSGFQPKAARESVRGVTLDIHAFIDGRDQLIIIGDTLQWHHFDFAAVGRHLGRNEPTSITSRRNGTIIMDQVEWFPEWSEPPPAEIRQEEFSSVFEALDPLLPSRDIRVELLGGDCENGGGAGSVTIVQHPSANNDYTLILEFDDNRAGGSAFYDISILLSVPGDLSGNLLLDAADIDELASAVRSGSFAPEFDLNGDRVLNAADHRYWVEELANTYYGDADLDGEFTSGDLVSIFQAGQYEDSMVNNSSWATGDWNGDREFTSATWPQMAVPSGRSATWYSIVKPAWAASM